MQIHRFSIMAALMLGGALAYAGAAKASPVELDAGEAPDGHRPHGPPPEAFTACESKSAGDACTVKFREHEHAGTCVTPPRDAPDTRLLCFPKDMPPPQDVPAH